MSCGGWLSDSLAFGISTCSWPWDAEVRGGGRRPQRWHQIPLCEEEHYQLKTSFFTSSQAMARENLLSSQQAPYLTGCSMEGLQSAFTLATKFMCDQWNGNGGWGWLFPWRVLASVQWGHYISTLSGPCPSGPSFGRTVQPWMGLLLLSVLLVAKVGSRWQSALQWPRVWPWTHVSPQVCPKVEAHWRSQAISFRTPIETCLH